MLEEHDSLAVTGVEAAETFAGLGHRYENRGVMAQGGMGVVFRAHDLKLSRDVAIKVLLFEGAKEPRLQERFLREAKTLAALAHPNIVKLLTWGVSEDGNPFFVMEFLEGGSLADEIGKGRCLTPTRFHEIFSQVLSGLHYAHLQGVVHRDCKPGNIMLCCIDERLCAKLIDFGIARQEEAGASQNLTGTGTVPGSPNYMSPEQCKGEQVDRRSDIYSLGCVMYEALTGQTPHAGDTAIDVMYRHTNVAATSLEIGGKSKEARCLGKLIDSCLEKDPQKRPPDAGALLAELNRIFANRIDTGKLFGPALEAASEPKSRIVAMILVLLIAAVASGVFFVAKPHRKTPAPELALAEAAGGQTKIRRQENFVHRLEGIYASNHNSPDKSERALDLYVNLQRLSELHRHSRDYQAAEETLNKALPLCQILCSDSDQPRATIMKDLSECKMGTGDYKSADRILEEAMRLRFGSETKSGLNFQLAKLSVKENDFDRALKAYDLAIPWLKNYDYQNKMRENMLARSSKVDYKSRVLDRTAELWSLFQEQPEPARKRLSAVKFLNRLAETSLDEKADYIPDLLEESSRLLGQIDRAEPGYALVAAQTSSLRSRCQGRTSSTAGRATGK